MKVGDIVFDNHYGYGIVQEYAAATAWRSLHDNRARARVWFYQAKEYTQPIQLVGGMVTDLQVISSGYKKSENNLNISE